MADDVLHSVLELRPPSWEHDAHAHAQRSSEWDRTRESLRAFANELPARKPLKHVRQEIVMTPSHASSSKSYQQSVERQDRESPLARQRQHLARNALALDKPMEPRRRQSAGHDSEPFPTGGPYFTYFPATLAKEKTMQEDVSMYVERVLRRYVYMHSATLYYWVCNVSALEPTSHITATQIILGKATCHNTRSQHSGNSQQSSQHQKLPRCSHVRCNEK